MTDKISNDNNRSVADAELRGPDAHGQAAMLLVESLIHGLIERSALTVTEAIEIVEVASQIKTEVADALGDSPATMRKSLALLSAISASLMLDT
jgi:hypothetical protein